MRRQIRAIDEVSDGIFFVQGPAVNWTIVHTANGPLLIDAGYPADGELVQESLHLAGTDADKLIGVLVTHGHSDHIGGIHHLRKLRTQPLPVITSQKELPNVTRRELHQVTARQLAKNLYHPGVLAWTIEAVKAGGLSEAGIPDALAFDPLQSPANATQIRTIPTAGHTPGHTCYALPDAGILITGDALVTGHPTSKKTGPQQLHAMFHTDAAQAAEAAAALSLAGISRILPGHGPSVRLTYDTTHGSVADLRENSAYEGGVS